MKALSIAWKDMLILVKDRGALLLLFVLPMVFIFIFSGALAQLGREEEDRGIPLPVVNLDAGGEASTALLDQLAKTGAVEAIPYEETEAQAALAENEISPVLYIPPGFSEAFAARQETNLRLVSHPEADSSEVEALRLVVTGVAMDMSLESQLIASLERMAEMQSASAGAAAAFTRDRILSQARSQWEAAQDQPLVAVRRLEAGTLDESAEVAGEDVPLGNVTVQVAGFTVLFVFLAAQHTARSIYDEKKVGSFRRLMAAPMAKATILAGKMIPNGITGLLQVAVIFAFGLLILPLLGMDRLSLGTDPLGLLVFSIIVVLCSASLGVLIAALARTDSQIGGISSLVVWGMGIVGGSFIPFYLFQDAFISSIGRFVPVYWANEGFFNLMVRGQNLAGVATEAAVLLGFTALFLAVGLWRFDFD